MIALYTFRCECGTVVKDVAPGYDYPPTTEKCLDCWLKEAEEIEKMRERYRGFTIQCQECGSMRVTIEETMFVCRDCKNKTDVFAEWRDEWERLKRLEREVEALIERWTATPRAQKLVNKAARRLADRIREEAAADAHL